MDFCKESDYYVSLYIDDMLEEAIKEEFENHLNECGKCSQKVKEALALVELCRESDDIMLPQNFSSSLHDRLVEVADKQKQNKGKLFIYNKKLIAGLSTAAVLVLTLLAYSLLPHTNLNRKNDSISSGTTAFTSTEDSVKDAAKNSAAASKEEAVQNPNSQESSNESHLSSDKMPAAKGSGALKDYPKKRVFEEKGENKVVSKSSQSIQEADEKLKDSKESIFRTKTAAAPMEYYSNTAEVILNTDTKDKENKDEALKGLMSELGGKELIADDKTIAIMANSSYSDYVIPLESFTKIQQLANDKYNLDISIKIPVTKENITEKYKELEKQRNVVSQKISDMEVKGNNTVTLEKERDDLSQKMDEIVKNSGMITVRISFADK
ncbi:putative transmembrane anti-sigma factor [Ruminiclostridium papyrosolvens DSM 2782]|uniref:Anti-sigma-W factor RsiW n=1 Tax=Ruminiclostridium papyrosolvens DSM 2782 TaxID=588581 RepID=F1THS5_9FIRM|nr:zf-HC2 domain-containing protein [Ruminiclostridium papyrosolvens]EGD46057.1 putative transmembrane anti-sigma factor [Ruminiclostridium papyrosolvens DSM 2782]WES32857.1 zf-HC2 domain-containing protein [Ruminiclostridium papyrosolvens DSM 2782]